MSRLVYHVVSGLKVGGAEMFLHRLVNHSRIHGSNHLIIALTPQGEMAERFRDSNISVIALDIRKNPISAFFKLVHIFRRDKPDIVQTWMYHSDLFGGIAAKLAGIKVVIWGVRTTDISSGARATQWIRRCCAKLSALVPTSIVCAAEASLRNHAAVGYSKKLMRVIPNGFEPDKLRAAMEKREVLRQSCGFLPTHIVVGSVGRFSEDKDQLNFIRAAALVAQECKHVRFLLVGRDLVSTNPELVGWLENSGFRERFVLLGERKDVAACLAAVDIFCLSSRTEGFPNVLGEAMAMGLPCVTTDVGDAALLLGGQGILVPPEDSFALAEGLRTIVKMAAEERSALGDRAYKRVAEEFSMENTSSKFEELYRQLDGRS
ncbi:glycosyltransferase family 4 protein [Pseudomonas sp. JBR1]|uniref:glycosyltransferase family 4 protein n=1 Tax=Pseudomonas sp. JBR1 TaxID=3020907 RepID=UPI0023055525|nr:glycosyltransferase [Pseudomonas sp. JBR1]WCE07569.1 glycosyltransferase [Pseudomonas sp. JBR1]